MIINKYDLTGNTEVSGAVLTLTDEDGNLITVDAAGKEITNPWLRSFLYYVPYVTLAVMTFPAIITATGNIWSGIAALVVGLLTAWFVGDLFVVAVSCCAAVFLTGFFL